MKVLVNILCSNDCEKEPLQSMVEACRSDLHEVHINICDYSLEKNLKNKMSCKVVDLPFEEIKDHEKKLSELCGQERYDVVIDIDCSIELEPDFLKDLELSWLDDENVGCIYSDFYSKSKNGHKIYIHQKSMPVVNNSLPLIAFSVDHYLRNIHSENVKGLIISNTISKHIPKALCSIQNA
tara:strand:- start:3719 stop:4261 length:543 start_codon:yes stop_codon:yes gene_type:complete